jgi:hypothetical protein
VLKLADWAQQPLLSLQYEDKVMGTLLTGTFFLKMQPFSLTLGLLPNTYSLVLTG